MAQARATRSCPHPVAVVGPGGRFEHVDRTVVEFRAFSPDEARRYMALEPALDCAGGFKAEALGISLFDRIESSDPTALIGLPLIALARLLREAGFALP